MHIFLIIIPYILQQKHHQSNLCASDDKCKYFSQWTYQRESDSRWCGTYKSCVSQSNDTNGPCLPDGAKVCPIKTFEKIGNFLNDLVNMVLLFYNIYLKYRHIWWRHMIYIFSFHVTPENIASKTHELLTQKFPVSIQLVEM